MKSLGTTYYLVQPEKQWSIHNSNSRQFNCFREELDGTRMLFRLSWKQVAKCTLIKVTFVLNIFRKSQLSSRIDFRSMAIPRVSKWKQIRVNSRARLVRRGKKGKMSSYCTSIKFRRLRSIFID